MPGTYGQRQAWILFGLGGLAAACGALALRRFRSRPLGNAEVSPGAAGRKPDRTAEAPDAESPPLPSPVAMAEADASPLPGSEPWLEPLRSAMERNPHVFGYGKSAWTAPLLVRYLQDTHGVEAPLAAVRKALKDLGYRWEHTRYVQARAGALQEGSTSEDMG